MPAKRPPARPAPARRAPPVTSPAPTSPDEDTPAIATRYRVLAAGISTPAGAVYRGASVTADQLGDAERVQKLISGGSIEEAVDDGS